MRLQPWKLYKVAHDQRLPQEIRGKNAWFITMRVMGAHWQGNMAVIQVLGQEWLIRPHHLIPA